VTKALSGYHRRPYSRPRRSACRCFPYAFSLFEYAAGRPSLADTFEKNFGVAAVVGSPIPRRRLVEFVREDAHGSRNGDALPTPRSISRTKTGCMSGASRAATNRRSRRPDRRRQELHRVLGVPPPFGQVRPAVSTSRASSLRAPSASAKAPPCDHFPALAYETLPSLCDTSTF
jgi:hypothetical protein